jgi:hypothetical protein
MRSKGERAAPALSPGDDQQKRTKETRDRPRSDLEEGMRELRTGKMVVK